MPKTKPETSRLEHDGTLRVKILSAPAPHHRLTLTVVVGDKKNSPFLIIDLEDDEKSEQLRAIVDTATAKELAGWLVDRIGARLPAQGDLAL